MVEDKPVIALTARESAKAERLVASAAFEGEAATLTLRIDGGAMTFEYEVANERSVLESGFGVTFLSTQAAGGFVGTVIGPYVHE